MSGNRAGDIFDIRFHNPSMNTIRAHTSYQGKLVDFCVPANPYFPPPALLEAIKENIGDVLKYYPDYAEVHQAHISDFVGIPAENIVAANGVTEIITVLCRDSPGPVLTSIPTFGRWTDVPPTVGVDVHFISRRKEDQFALSVNEIVKRARETQTATLVISNPNNPTGACLSMEEIRKLAAELRDLPLIVIDESFIEFSDIESAEQLAADSCNVMVVKSMGKSLGWHGVRLGYSVSNAALASELRVKIPYWNINGLAAFVLANLSRYKDLYRQSFVRIHADRDYMFSQLSTVRGLTIYPSQANFLFIELPPGISGKSVRDALLERHGVVVRECSNKVGSSENYLRCVVRPKEEVDRLVEALRSVLPKVASIGVAA